MPKDPAHFSDEELDALLRDATVSASSIAAEMSHAGAEPLAVDALEQTRALVANPAGIGVDGLLALPERLRTPLLRAFADAAGAGVISPEAVSGLATSKEKAIAKEGKRILHLLRAKGVKIETKRQEQAQLPLSPPPTAVEESPVHMTSVDAFGDRIVLFSRVARGGVDVAQLVLNESRGVIDVRMTPLPKRDYRRFVQTVAQGGLLLMGEVPRAYARGLISNALDQNARSRTPVPASWNDVAFILGPSVPVQRSPGRMLTQTAESASDPTTLPELQSWLKTPTAFEGMPETVEQFWTRGRRETYAERLFDLAHLLVGVSRTSDAAGVLALARALESEVDAHALPFCVTLVERAFPKA